MVQLVKVVAQRRGVEQADDDGELAFTDQSAEVGGGVGDAGLCREILGDAGDDPVAHFQFVGHRGLEPWCGAVWPIGPTPELRP
ncbi:hypothetical protein D3C76_1203090 [compost metagenome]